MNAIPALPPSYPPCNPAILGHTIKKCCRDISAVLVVGSKLCCPTTLRIFFVIIADRVNVIADVLKSRIRLLGRDRKRGLWRDNAK